MTGPGSRPPRTSFVTSEDVGTVEDVTEEDPGGANNIDDVPSGDAADNADNAANLPAPTPTGPAISGRSALDSITEAQGRAMLRGFRPSEMASMRRTVEMAQKALAKAAVNIDKTQLDPFLEHVSKTLVPFNDRIRAQVAAAMPDITVTVPQIVVSMRKVQFDALNNIVAKGVLNDIAANIVIPTISLENVYGDQLKSITSALANMQKVIDRIDWESVTAEWYPPNWDRDRGTEQYATFIELAAEDCLPMTWVPNRELTYILADADDADARDKLLLEHSETIVADCRAVIDDFDARTNLTSGLIQALDAYVAGLHGPAQSHASSILDTALRQVITLPKKWSYGAAKKALRTDEDWRSFELRIARIVPTTVAVANMLTPFWGGDPIPTKPNRHASAHAVSEEQVNQLNAIKFLMVATATLAEVEYGGWARLLSATAV